MTFPSSEPAPSSADATDAPDVMDVCIVGAGLAGSSAAFVLGRAGYRVMVVDPRIVCAPCFKAEKIEPDQAHTLRELGLFDAVHATAQRIHVEVTGRNGMATGSRVIEQYGIHYHDMVNSVRQEAEAVAKIITGRVVAIQASDHLQNVELSDGRCISARLVILACGSIGSKLHANLGLRKRVVSEHHSMSYGFSIERSSGEPFPFEALTYAPSRLDQPIAYLTLFNRKDGMRANLFAYQPPTDPDVRRYLADPITELNRQMPGLDVLCGEVRLTSHVEVFSIDLFVTENVERPGLVLIGDAFQSVCPSTGTGLSKVLTDVDVLCRACIPAWLNTPGMGAAKITQFYFNARKQAVDSHSLGSAITMRRTATDRSAKFRVFRARQYVARWLGSLL
ncbi:MAG: FAD-dependent monooxygenase [Gemmatimonadetes bacterium]|nr:FAD-dependent monooxygenase [Gemmatimonadota bacterium]